MKKKRVLVTGGAGYIGSCVVELLIEKGHFPVVFDTFFFGKDQFMGREDQLQLIEGDIRNARDVSYALEGIDGVIHLAGIVGQPACAYNHKAHYTTNVESTHTLVNCMTDHEMDLVRDLVFCSSCSVYGNVAGMYEEVVETTPTMPLSEYAHGKLRAEHIILNKAKEMPQFSPTIVRLTTIFGWSPRPRLDLVTNLFAYKAVKGDEITIFGGGRQYRSLIHVRDVASALVTALEAPRYLRHGEIFHVGEETNNVQVRELADKVKALVPDARITFRDEEDTDRRDYKINCQKIKNALNWKAKYSVDQGLEEMIEKLRTQNWDFTQQRFRNVPFDYR
ncbi:MAG TPA: NAD-dependent epimerase/dehydratase family protein [Rhizobiaceae bacterium]|jgi:nucleoside-diphosphate-sugar epimerase|nr:NAD-dependent epimerase/dehydratase family protein [Rhizobiaceae bacterium]